MTQAIGDVLVSAVAVAISPVPIVAIILILGSARARATGVAFALGWIAGLGAVLFLAIHVFLGADDPSSGAATSTDWLRVAVGALFVAMAARQWRQRPRDGETPAPPRWMARVDSMPPPRAALLGAVLSGANPKNFALTVTAGASIAEAGLSSGDSAIALVVFMLLGSLTIAGPVGFYLLDSDRAAGPLESVRRFMSVHNAAIMMVILALLGAKLIGNGLGGGIFE